MKKSTSKTKKAAKSTTSKKALTKGAKKPTVKAKAKKSAAKKTAPKATSKKVNAKKTTAKVKTPIAKTAKNSKGSKVVQPTRGQYFTTNIAVAPKLIEKLDQQIKAGKYGSRSEFFRQVGEEKLGIKSL